MSCHSLRSHHHRVLWHHNPSSLLTQPLLLFLILVPTILLSPSFITLASSCQGAPNDGSIGDITRDTELEEGTPFNITCSLSVSTAMIGGRSHPINESNIVFEFKGEKVLKNQIIRRPNSASISFPSGVRMADSGSYYCYVVSEEANDDNYGRVSNALVCSMYLEVGKKPSKENVNLDCISESYENLTCSWTTPDYGTPVDTSLLVMYVGNRAAKCPIQLSPNSCQWTMTSTPPYRQVAKKLVMILRVTNKYGSEDIGKTISHFSIVRPGKPVNLAVHDLQSKRMTLSWGKPYAFEHLDSQDDDVPHLMFNVKVSGVKSGKVFSDSNMTETSIDLRKLTPWTEYNVSIRAFTNESNDMRYWSDSLFIRVTTSEDVPSDTPPFEKAFESVSLDGGRKRHVRVYWKPLTLEDFHGPGGHYIIRVFPYTKGNPIPVSESVNHLTKRHAMYSISSTDFNRNDNPHQKVSPHSLFQEFNISWTAFYHQFDLSTSAFTIHLHTANQLGISESFSQMIVDRDDSWWWVLSPSSHNSWTSTMTTPSASLSLSDTESHHPSPLEVAAFSVDKNQFEVHWTQLESPRKAVNSYTVSWCTYNAQRPGGNLKCTGAINSTTVPYPMSGIPFTSDGRRGVAIETIPLEAGYQFGVSVNFGDNTSAPVKWADCVVPINMKKPDKVHAVHAKALNSTTIKVSWKLNCDSLRSVISKFDVSYCPTTATLLDANITKCDGEPNFVQVFGGSSEEVIISGLKPRTPYRLVLRSWTETTAGDDSDVMIEFTSKEDLPLWIITLTFLAVLTFVLLIVGLLTWAVNQYRKMREEMKVPIQLPGRLAGEKYWIAETSTALWGDDDGNGRRKMSRVDVYRQESTLDDGAGEALFKPIFRKGSATSSSESGVSTEDLFTENSRMMTVRVVSREQSREDHHPDHDSPDSSGRSSSGMTPPEGEGRSKWETINGHHNLTNGTQAPTAPHSSSNTNKPTPIMCKGGYVSHAVMSRMSIEVSHQ